MINFNSKITKSIIIAIFILSLTISIYVVPASAIVTGTLSAADISTLFSLDNYRYYRIRGNMYDESFTQKLGSSIVYPNSSEFSSFILYPYLEGNHVGITNANSSLQFYSRYVPYGNNTKWAFYSAGLPLEDDEGNIMEYRVDDYIRFFLPIGIQNSNKITIQFMILTTKTYKDTFSLVFENALRDNYIRFYGVDNSGTSYNLKSSTFEYEGIAQYSNIGPDENGTGTTDTYYAKVFDIEISNIDFLNYIYCDFNPRKDLTNGAMTNLYFGVTKIYYEGANSQLTEIQGSLSDIESVLDDILHSSSGSAIVGGLQDDFNSSETGLDDIIGVLDSVDKPDPNTILPSYDDIMGDYVNGPIGSVGLHSISPLFDENGVIYIMLFGVLSVALISYVLFGKKT